MRRRTVREFPYRQDLWPTVESWAAQTGYAEREQSEHRRLYRRGGGLLLMAPAFVEIRHEGRKVVLEAWVKADLFVILNFFTGEKPEVAIEPGGLSAAVPRKRARAAVNQLLARLQQPSIA
jgi:hypothetical protein